MNLLQKNTRKQGDVGLGQAVAYFTSLGYSVSLPLTESQRYDIIVDDGEKLYRVEVKTSRYKNKYGRFKVVLGTWGGNQTFKGERKAITKNDSDYVFIYTQDGDKYLIDTENLDGMNQLTIGPGREKYRI